MKKILHLYHTGILFLEMNGEMRTHSAQRQPVESLTTTNCQLKKVMFFEEGRNNTGHRV